MRKKHFLHENEKKTLANLFTKADLPPHAEVEVTVKWVGKNGQTKYAHIPILSEEEGIKKSKHKGEEIIERMRGKATVKDLTTDEIMRMTRGGEW